MADLLLGDEIGRTATQVRLDQQHKSWVAAVHRVSGSLFEREFGWRYRTSCRQTLVARDGAILTTREVTCSGCLKPRRPQS